MDTPTVCITSEGPHVRIVERHDVISVSRRAPCPACGLDVALMPNMRPRRHLHKDRPYDGPGINRQNWCRG